MRYKFSRKLRLTNDPEFKRAFNSKKIVSGVCAIFYCNNNLGYSRLGVIAAKKNIKQANKRNYFKRTVRESFRLKQYNFGSVDLIVFAYKNAENRPRGELSKCIEKQLEELILRQKKQLLR